MYERECACEKFERLEGAAMQLHISDFLILADSEEQTGKTWYRCRRCGAHWKLIARTDHRQAMLVRLANEFNV